MSQYTQPARLPMSAADAEAVGLAAGVVVRHGGLEIAVGGLLADPFEKRLEQRMGAKMIDLVELAFEGAVVEDGVDLLVARLAQRHAVLSPSASRLGLEVMECDQPTRNVAQTEEALLVIIHAQQV